MVIKKGTWIEVEEIVLSQEERAANVPLDTKNTPLRCWIRGVALEDCEIGKEAEIVTNIGRRVRGIVVAEEPGYYHTYGGYVSELSHIGRQGREILEK
ncbi:2-amino-4-oxopentanoate thiolase subunit OrtA [Alloiococcus sp. CFN-8]|uniref:2-amino-4-oxopentanoate thiolase subunit OrtA n=1 Tax=Alloiococcus sp. CFN-8 TaxID=3416081 RepID=UPI003CF93EE5